MKHLLHILMIVVILLMAVSPALAATSAAEESTSPAISLTTTDVLILVFGLGFLVVQVLKSKPLQADKTLARELEKRQLDREYMDRLERAYQEGNRQLKAVVDTFASGLRFVAPYTPIKVDDMLGGFLDDIRTPGAPGDNLTYDPSRKAVPPYDSTANPSPIETGSTAGEYTLKI